MVGESSPKRFTLAVLFRVLTLLSFAMGWIALTCSASPSAVFIVLLMLGGVLAVVVARRRMASFWVRVVTAGVFVAACTYVALYSAGVAEFRQVETNHRQIVNEDGLLEYGWLIVGFPFFVATLVFLMRAWTWSAHDWRIRQETYN